MVQIVISDIVPLQELVAVQLISREFLLIILPSDEESTLALLGQLGRQSSCSMQDQLCLHYMSITGALLRKVLEQCSEKEPNPCS